MKLNIDEIKNSVEQKKIKAISIDTSIFDQKQRGLEWGLLKRIQQFKDTSVVFLLPEIVKRELESHLHKDAIESEVALNRTLRLMSTSWCMSSDTRENIVKLATGQVNAESIVKTRLDSFLNETDAVLLETADHVSMPELLERYFKQQPPFGQKEGKKYEFPDALALLSLERWATINETLILVITTDPDWQSYCDESERLIGINDLAEGFSCFQEQEASYICKELAKSIVEGDPHGLYQAIESGVRAKDSTEVTIEADSQFRCEEEGFETQFMGISIRNISGLPYLEPIEYDGETLVASLVVEISAEITAYFSFEKWDGIDREYFSMGSGQASSTENLSVEILVTFGGDLLKAPIIENIEVDSIEAAISFVDLEPDWMSDPTNFG